MRQNNFVMIKIPQNLRWLNFFGQEASWAQDVICFDSFLGQKMFDKVIVQVSLSVVVVIF